MDPTDPDYVLVAGGPARSPRCVATARKTGHRCEQPAIKGATVCVYHGGSTRHVREAARRRLAETAMSGEVAALREELSIGEDLSEADVLLEAVRRARIEARVYEHLVGALAPTPEAGSDGKPKAALYGPDHLGDARPHALVVQLERWNAEAGRLAKMAIDAGVATARLRLEEAAVDELVSAMRAFSEAMGQALELALVAAGVEPELVRQARIDAEPAAFRRALEPLAAIEATASERLPEAASGARDGQQSAN